MTEKECHEVSTMLQVYDYYAGGADTESTVHDNRAVYGRYRLLPRYMVDVSHVDLSYTLLGECDTFDVACLRENATQCVNVSSVGTGGHDAVGTVEQCCRSKAKHANYCGPNVATAYGR